MSQIPLINTATMSSARQFAKHVRERDSAFRKLASIPGSKSPAAPAAAAAATSTALPAPYQANAMPPSSTPPKRGFTSGASKNMELNLPDESRVFEVGALPRCPDCNGQAILARTTFHYSGIAFMVHCENMNLIVQLTGENLCRLPKPTWMKTSQQAVAHWKMVCALTKDL
jgi:hypothetical protein